jgi:hypothetical protein
MEQNGCSECVTDYLRVTEGLGELQSVTLARDCETGTGTGTGTDKRDT